MLLNEFKILLAGFPTANLRFRLPDGNFTPAHAHVTEVARMDKHFIDCGGTVRRNSYCRLQTWVAHDVEHRLTATKLLRILELARPLLLSETLEVDIEHEAPLISQFPIAGGEVLGAELVFQLATRHTACLAEELCCPPTQQTAPADPRKLNFRT